MISLRRLNGHEFVLSCDLIKFVEATPDTIITLTTGEKLMVRETVREVVSAATDYRKRLYQEGPSWTGPEIIIPRAGDSQPEKSVTRAGDSRPEK